jgi:hypothetical protein
MIQTVVYVLLVQREVVGRCTRAGGSFARVAIAALQTGLFPRAVLIKPKTKYQI